MIFSFFLTETSVTERSFFMRRSKETYEKVGCACSHYREKPFPGQVYNLAGEPNGRRPSCLTCTHFKDEHCDIDLYDKIAERMK